MLAIILIVVVAVLIVGGLGLVVTTRSRRHGAPDSSEPIRRSSDSSPESASSSGATRDKSSVATLSGPETEPEKGQKQGSGLAEQGPKASKQRDAAGKEPPGRHDLYGGMGKSRGLISGYLKSLRSRSALNDSIWDEMEEALLGSDVGLGTSDAVLESLREKVKAGAIKDTASILPALKAEILSYFTSNDTANDHPATGDAQSSNDAASVIVAKSGSAGDSRSVEDGRSVAPSGFADNISPGRSLRFDEGVVNIWLFIGVNGVGKTTTIGKVALSQVGMGRSVLLAAGDTFRAAAGEQLEVWGERVGAEVIRGKEGGDPGAVVFDAVERAKAKGYDLVLADTAGRLHTNINLVEELKKIYRVAARSGVVSEVLLVLDATTGQNGLVQARQFTDAVGVTGIVLTKLDGTARGGIVVAIERDLGIPVKMVGIGEGVDDLIAFDPSEFVEALFG